jgi:hypothetical protein
MKVLAAIAPDLAASRVLAGSAMIAQLLRADVEALHVQESRRGDQAQDRDETAAAAAAAAGAAGVPIRMLRGQPIGEIAEAAAASDVVAVALGSRGTVRAETTGHTALALIAAVEKLVLVVSPQAVVRSSLRRMLVPLDRDLISATAVGSVLHGAASADVEVVVAHIQEEETLPAFGDHLAHEVQAWSEEFVARRLPQSQGTRLELRVGEPAERILEICEHCGCDLVALGWRRDLSAGRARIVRAMLAQSPVPVLLAPISTNASGTLERAGEDPEAN